MIRLIEEGAHSKDHRHPLDPDRRYSLIEVAGALFAYTDFGHYLRGLGQAWRCGFVPKPLPSALGRELLELPARLRGVDADLSRLELSDLEPLA